MIDLTADILGYLIIGNPLDDHWKTSQWVLRSQHAHYFMAYFHYILNFLFFI